MTRSSPSHEKTLDGVAAVPRHEKSPGLSIAQLNGEFLADYMDPFLMVDHFHMAQPFFPPHPHAGFSAVTYMFPNSRNGFINRDSRGDRSIIGPGAMHWTTAGAGIVHEEVPIKNGVVCDGLQIFVNLAAKDRLMSPESHQLEEADVPKERAAGREVRVVVGSHAGLTSPLAPPVDVVLLDVSLGPGGTFRHEFPAGQIGFVYAVSGAADFGPSDRPVRIAAGAAGGFGPKGAALGARSEGGVHFVLAAGKPLKEPLVSYGPFVMSTSEQIQQAVKDYQSGKMGRLDQSF